MSEFNELKESFIDEFDLELSNNDFETNVGSRSTVEAEFSDDSYESDFEDADFLRNVDVAAVITSQDAFNCMIAYDSTVHVVGFVKNIESPAWKGPKKDKLLFKFTLQNFPGEQIVQLFAWDDVVKKVVDFVKPNSVIHVDGAFANFRNPKFSNGNTIMDLTIRSNTVINVLSKGIESISTEHPKFVSLEEICDIEGLIRVEGYVKAAFRENVMYCSSSTYECGCIAQGAYKIEVRLRSIVNKKNYVRGDLIAVVGKLQFNGKLPHILVEDYDCIEKLDGKRLEDDELIKATKIPKKINSCILQLALRNQESAEYVEGPALQFANYYILIIIHMYRRLRTKSNYVTSRLNKQPPQFFLPN